MKFVLPNCEYEEKAKEYIQEFQEYQSDINGCGGLVDYLEESTYEEWVKKIMDELDMTNLMPGKVPSFTYFYVREEDDRIIGMVNIRLVLQDFWQKEGGHIGYSIRPTERRKHYGTNLLKDALEFCKIVGLDEVIVSCIKENVASAGVVKNCGGKMEAEFYSTIFKEVIQRYKICI